jgi:glycosyltransferase involved in cell wall biosynthesis
MKISAVLITYNEAACIANTLSKLVWCDEIVVVDSYSTDETVTICEKYNCKIFYKKFEGYGTQKQFAVSCASYDWILSIDADEIVTEELKNEIQVLRKTPIESIAFQIPRSLIFMQQKLRFGGEYRSWQLRLFNRKVANFDDAIIHEKVIVKEGKITKLQHELLHYSFVDLEDYFYKFNRYTSLAAEKLYQEDKYQPILVIMLRLPFDFFYRYFLSGLFLDGFAGFVWALFACFYPIVKYIKVIEKRKIATLGT